jgi:hypothetical protein
MTTDNFCRYGDVPVTVEAIRIDHLDGHGPRNELRVAYFGAYCCTHTALNTLYVHHSPANITCKG